jgi:hypothetical protein
MYSSGACSEVKMDHNIFKLSRQNIAFLRIFQRFGFLPHKLVYGESEHAKCAAWGLVILLIFISALRLILIETEVQQTLLFLWDILALLICQVRAYFMSKRHVNLLKLLGEIDERVSKNLGLKNRLEVENARVHRRLIVVWIFYGVINLYYPLTKIIKMDFSMAFFDALFRIFTW